MNTTTTPNRAEKVTPKISLKNILCATDFSSTSSKALGYAAAIARSQASKLYLVHVLPEQVLLELPLEPLPDSMDRGLVEATHKMDSLLAEKWLAGIEHEEIVKHGLIQHVIADLIDKKQINLLVLGTHGRGGLNKILLGSTVEQLFRSALCPVLTVGAWYLARVPSIWS